MPQVNPTTSAPKIVTNPIRMGWKNIILGLFIGTTLIGGGLVAFYYFELKNLSSSENPQVTVTKPNTTTDSAAPKPEQPKVVPDGTLNQGVYESKNIGFQIKLLTNWTNESEEEISEDEFSVKFKKNTAEIQVHNKRLGVGGPVEEVELLIGEQIYDFVRYNFDDENFGYLSNKEIKNNDNEYGFLIIIEKTTHQRDLEEVKKILSTFKFLD